MERQERIEKRFSWFKAPVSNIVPEQEKMSVLDVYKYIRTDAAKTQTEYLRSITDPKTRKKYKAQCFHTVTFSGIFSRRQDDCLIEHSELLCLDFDHVTNLERVRAQLLGLRQFKTILLFVSPSGDGLKWVIQIDLRKASHKQWFEGVGNYLKKTLGLMVDSSGANVSRACFLPHDPECYIDPHLLPRLVEIDREAGKDGLLLDFMEAMGASEITIKQNEDGTKYNI